MVIEKSNSVIIIFFLTFMACLCAKNIYAQDLLKIRGKEYNVKITELGKNSIHFYTDLDSNIVEHKRPLNAIQKYQYNYFSQPIKLSRELKYDSINKRYFFSYDEKIAIKLMKDADKHILLAGRKGGVGISLQIILPALSYSFLKLIKPENNQLYFIIPLFSILPGAFVTYSAWDEFTNYRDTKELYYKELENKFR